MLKPMRLVVVIAEVVNQAVGVVVVSSTKNRNLAEAHLLPKELRSWAAEGR